MDPHGPCGRMELAMELMAPLCPQPVPLGPLGSSVSSSAAVPTTPPATPPMAHVPVPQARPGPTVRLVSGGRAGAPRVPSPTLGTDSPPHPTGNPDVPYSIEPAPPAAYSPLGMVLSLVALVVLLVAVVVTALCYHRWQKGKERQHLAVAYRAAGQTDTSDYMVPGQPGAVQMWPQPRWPSGTRLTAVPPDVPPSHHAHYYSNPSYHTLSQCPLPAPGPQDRASSLKVWQGVAQDSTVLHGAAQNHCHDLRGEPAPFLGSRCLAASCSPAWRDPSAPKAMPRCLLTGNTSGHQPWAPGVRKRGKAALVWILARVGWAPESLLCSGSPGWALGWGGRAFLLGGKMKQRGLQTSSLYRQADGPELHLQPWPEEV